MEQEAYRKLIVWQKSITLVKEIYQLLKLFPREELYGISAQMKRSAISIPSNIAEGNRRGTRMDYRHFLLNAYGSGAELETQLEVGKMLGFGDAAAYVAAEQLLNEVMRMLNTMVKKLNTTKQLCYT